jgi:hypothetical protein
VENDLTRGVFTKQRTNNAFSELCHPESRDVCAARDPYNFWERIDPALQRTQLGMTLAVRFYDRDGAADFTLAQRSVTLITDG